jgi:hypothetical protein
LNESKGKREFFLRFWLRLVKGSDRVDLEPYGGIKSLDKVRGRGWRIVRAGFRIRLNERIERTSTGIVPVVIEKLIEDLGEIDRGTRGGFILGRDG